MRRFCSTYEAARLLGVSLPTVVNWIAAHRLKAHRTPGGHRRIAREDLAAFMLRHGMPLPSELADLVRSLRKALIIAEAGQGLEDLVQQLSAAGYEVRETPPGFSAGAATVRFQPDVVILDAEWPGSGETLEGLRADPELAAIPVVVVGRADWLERLDAAGCSRAVLRPLEGCSGVDAVEAVQKVAVASGRRTRG